MNLKKASQTYQKIEEQSFVEPEDTHTIVLTMLRELIRSIDLFEANIDLKEGDQQIKSKHFSRALTIIYALQSSLDFKKVAKSPEVCSSFMNIAASNYSKI